jgi:Ca2+-binding EF-hand superfamily protein
MASSLTSAQRQELKDAFDVFDTGRHINKKNHPFFYS